VNFIKISTIAQEGSQSSEGTSKNCPDLAAVVC